MFHQCSKQPQAWEARDKKLKLALLTQSETHILVNNTETEERFMNECVSQLLIQYKDRYKFSSHTFILAGTQDSHHHNCKKYNSH